jgi:hypothetical protein
MKTIFKTIIIPLACCMFLASCSLVDFSEDCTYYGDVKIRFDWSGLLKGDTKPDKMQTTFYGKNVANQMEAGHAYIYTLQGDTLLNDIAEGSYNILSCNPADGISLSNQKGNITASLPVYRENNKSYTIQAPVLYAGKEKITVQPFETSLLKLQPESCIQQIGIDFVIIRENLDREVISLSGELSGVSTGYSLSGMSPLEAYASLAFKSIRQQENNFNSKLNVFGLSANVMDNDSGIANMLNVSLLLSGGTVYSQDIDLTDTFYGFTSPAIHLTVEIRLSALGINISLTDWYFVDQGEIEI